MRTSGGQERWSIVAPALLLTLLGFIVAYQFVEPAPPRSLVLATGGVDGAYHQFGLRYREILARSGVRVELRQSAGSVENLALLRRGEVDAALVQGGLADPAAVPGLAALASLYHEPLWVFLRAPGGLADLRDLRGKRLALGAEGSGTRAVATQLLARNAVDAGNSAFLPLGGQAAAAALRSGEVDALFVVAAPSAPSVDALLRDPQLVLLDFGRAEAYARLFRFLDRVLLPAGLVDLAAGIPAHDVRLLAPAATLVAGEGLHPALAVLLLQAATEVHGGGDAFAAPGSFPSAQGTGLPLRAEAAHYHASGPPFLQRYLPFWAATLVDRLKVMLVPLLTLLIPLFKIVPPTYRWRVRSRIYRWYRDLRTVEGRILGTPDAQTRDWAYAELARIEHEVALLNVPLSYADQLFNLRLHINFVRRELQAAAGAETTGAVPAD
ncbi:MAG TPA: TAXI family TRAP transporter solute-binding subunit [Gammaproteobacteria bacterium]